MHLQQKSEINTSQSYTGIAKLLHWLMAGIWIAVWVVGVLAVYFRESLNPNHVLTFWHKAFGSVLFFLLVIRVVWRLANKPPGLPSHMTMTMRRAAYTGHIFLYLLALTLLPISGWIWSSVADKPIMVLGLFQLPALLEPRPEAYGIAKWFHVICAWSSLAIVVGHVVVAFKHHLIDRDNVLLGMLPNFRKKR